MNKINGYTEEEAKNLVEFIWRGKQAGKTLSNLFALYGEKYGRAKGSVRNYYYTLMKNQNDDERVYKMLEGKNLTVENIREFTEEETNDALRKILQEKSKGLSVRRAVFNVSKGDDKLMLRLQNKYRNVVKKQPEKLEEIARELGMNVSPQKSFSEKRLEREIDALYERIALPLKQENLRLREENRRLKQEAETLKQRTAFGAKQ